MKMSKEILTPRGRACFTG